VWFGGILKYFFAGLGDFEAAILQIELSFEA
jgi:hypothetical protein